jgi:hypothetical protein
MNPSSAFVDPDEAARLVERFERAALDLDAFHHHEHLIVAAWLAANAPVDEALSRMRTGLRANLARTGKDAYHETVTVFWMRVLAHRLSCCESTTPLGERLGAVVHWAEQTQPIQAHYSPERLAGAEARHSFVEPDRLPLPVSVT